MEKVGPIPTAHASQGLGRTIPIGKGWVLEPMQTGFLLKALAQGAQVRITAEEAQSLRDGQITPQDLAARHGLVPHLPSGAAVSVAFSEEARRLAGSARPQRAAASPDTPTDPEAKGFPMPSPVTTAAILAAFAILALALAI